MVFGSGLEVSDSVDLNSKEEVGGLFSWSHPSRSGCKGRVRVLIEHYPLPTGFPRLGALLV